MHIKIFPSSGTGFARISHSPGSHSCDNNFVELFTFNCIRMHIAKKIQTDWQSYKIDMKCLKVFIKVYATIFRSLVRIIFISTRDTLNNYYLRAHDSYPRVSLRIFSRFTKSRATEMWSCEFLTVKKLFLLSQEIVRVLRRENSTLLFFPPVVCVFI
jgi:hypothetical protein